MDKLKQRALTQWLKSQAPLARTWLIWSIFFAFLSGIFLIAQAGILAHILHQLIVEGTPREELALPFVALLAVVFIRGSCSFAKERMGYRAGETIRCEIRHLIMNKLSTLGPAVVQGKPPGEWASLLLEQVEEMHDFFARYLPQMAIAVLLPFLILIAVFPLNWAAGLIFLLTAPLVPFFMMLVGIGAADANRKNFKALQRLSGHFYDRLRALPTIRLFDRAHAESEHLSTVSEEFRKRTMAVLRLAFLSSAVLEFFTAISIALTAVYFGFSFLGELDFGHYGLEISLFIGLFVLILAPEFYQPLRDLGTFYHAKAQAVGAAEAIVDFLEQVPDEKTQGQLQFTSKCIEIKAKDFEVLSMDGTTLAGPMSFKIECNEQVHLVGESGAGKTSVLNGILGFLPYRGSLKINKIELRELDLSFWRKHISWVGQNPQLFHGSIRHNICLAKPDTNDEQMQKAAREAHADEFIQRLEQSYDYSIGDRMSGLSVGQAQRIAVARALIQAGQFWVLDEPSASLDRESEKLVMASLQKAIENHTALIVTHRLAQIRDDDSVFVLADGKLAQQGKFGSLKHEGALANLLNQGQKVKHA